MTRQCPVLMDLLAEIPDFRQAHGKRHPLPAILALAVAAMLCGYRSYSAIAEWGHNDGKDLLKALGFTRKRPPCAATLHTIFRHLDQTAVEAKLTHWVEGVLRITEEEMTVEQGEALNIDGKALRGSRKQGAPAAHLLSALGQRLGVTLGQVAVDDKTNEITAIQRLLTGLIIEGRIITADALLTQREVAQAIIDQGGDYLMVVKGNQPALLDEIEAVFADRENLSETIDQAATLDSGHGRIEQRRLTSSTALIGYSNWPGMQQVCEIAREVTVKRTGEHRAEVVYAITSLSRERAGAKKLLELSRGHWSIENKSHYVRDVTFDEDRSQVRKGNIPQVMAALRNTAIGVMRVMGETNIAAACRRFAARPWLTLAVIGIPQRTE